MTVNSFKYALSLVKLMFDIDMNPYDFEEIGLIAWNFIGNRRCRLYRYTTKIDCDTLSIKLPCNTDVVEAVTYSFEDWNYSTNSSPNGDLNSAFVEQYIESRKPFKNPLYLSGKYANYTQVGNVLYFDKNYGNINILYKGVILDEEGLPEITDKEAIAIATYCAYTTKYKEGIRTNNTGIILIANMLKQDWKKSVDAARVPVYINLNEMNQILDIGTRYDRKIFGKKYTPVLR